MAFLLVYPGIIAAAIGFLGIVKPIRRLGMATRARAAIVAAAGLLLALAGFLVPARESRISGATTRLDEFMPVWQFHERHSLEISAPPESVFKAIRQVRAEEIALFRLLTWIRRGGQPVPDGILNAGSGEPLIDVALKGGFVPLAEDAPRELVIGTVVRAPRGTRGKLTPEVFRKELPPGFALAAMNFVVTPIGQSRSLVFTETRVFANSASARRSFAIYWRLIYPGSAIIRVMWLRAIRKRATVS